MWAGVGQVWAGVGLALMPPEWCSGRNEAGAGPGGTSSSACAVAQSSVGEENLPRQSGQSDRLWDTFQDKSRYSGTERLVQGRGGSPELLISK